MLISLIALNSCSNRPPSTKKITNTTQLTISLIDQNQSPQLTTLHPLPLPHSIHSTPPTPRLPCSSQTPANNFRTTLVFCPIPDPSHRLNKETNSRLRSKFVVAMPAMKQGKTISRRARSPAFRIEVARVRIWAARDSVSVDRVDWVKEGRRSWEGNMEVRR